MISCKEFEELLPEIIDGGEWSADQRSHAQGCQPCTGLVNDLRTIAQEAKQLAASEEPSPRVWQELSKSLEAEGLIRPQARHGILDLFALPRWRQVLVPLTAAAALAIGFLVYRSDVGQTNSTAGKAVPSVGTTDTSAMLDADDLQLLQDLETKAPNMRASYEENLKHANRYIKEAQQNVKENPDDEGAREQLMQAYEQKSMVYDMAMDRSLR